MHELVEQLPDEQVQAAVSDLKARLAPAPTTRSWPPACFGIAEGSADDVSERPRRSWLKAGDAAQRDPPRYRPDRRCSPDRDIHHRAGVDLFTSAHLAGESLLVPSTVVTEVCYLLEREAGPRAEAAFLTSLADGDLTVVDLKAVDWARAAALVNQYADLPLGGVVASVVAFAERLGVYDIATIDRRHFSVGALVTSPPSPWCRNDWPVERATPSPDIANDRRAAPTKNGPLRGRPVDQ